MRDVQVIAEPGAAAALLDPMRARVLAELRAPGSSSSVAAAIGEPRQKVNYHLRQLEDHGLVQFVEERQRRGLVERVVVASARSYVVSPAALGDNAPVVERSDQLSAAYLVALAGRVITEVGQQGELAEANGTTLPTLAIDTEIRFRSAADRAEFTAELADAVTRLAAKYHQETAPGGRWHRLLVGAYPAPPINRSRATTSAGQPRAAQRTTDHRTDTSGDVPPTRRTSHVR